MRQTSFSFLHMLYCEILATVGPLSLTQIHMWQQQLFHRNSLACSAQRESRRQSYATTLCLRKWQTVLYDYIASLDAIGFKGPLNTVNNQRGHSPCRLRMRIFSCNCQQLSQASLAAVFVLGVTPSSCESLTAMPGRGSARKRPSASAARRGRGRGSRRSAAGPTTRQAANVTVTSSAAGSAPPPSSPVNSAPHFDLAQMLELVRAEVAAEFQAHQQIASGTLQQPRPQPATMQSAAVQHGVPQLDTSLPTQPAVQYGIPQLGTSFPTQPAVPPLALPGT